MAESGCQQTSYDCADDRFNMDDVPKSRRDMDWSHANYNRVGVTCAHNIICDVSSSGGAVQFDGDQTRDIQIDGGLVTAKHPGVVDEFMKAFVREIEK